MEMKQIYEIVNEARKFALGEEAITLAEDLENIVDVGNAIFNANAVDAYCKALVNRIGKVIFVNRPYTGRAPKVLMDSWEFGSVLMKSHAGLPEAQENESWKLEDGASYDQDIFYQPKVEVKFFNKRTTFEIPMSFTDEQLKQSFVSPQELGSFVSMLYTAVENAMVVYADALIMRTIDNFIGQTLEDGGSAVKVNLLAGYKTEVDTSSTLTAETCLYSKEFLRYASAKIMLASKRMRNMSKVFNLGGTSKHTPIEDQRVIMLDLFVTQASTYLDSDTFHNELVKLPNADTVSFWQGSGTDYAWGDISKIKVKTVAGDSVEQSGILAFIFDRNALGVSCFNRRTPTHYNSKAEFWNNYYKEDAGYFNDFNENGIVFYVAD